MMPRKRNQKSQRQKNKKRKKLSRPKRKKLKNKKQKRRKKKKRKRTLKSEMLLTEINKLPIELEKMHLIQLFNKRLTKKKMLVLYKQ